jgi:hypothetical protein
MNLGDQALAWYGGARLLSQSPVPTDRALVRMITSNGSALGVVPIPGSG